jgi:hypothetical protein
MPGLCRGRASSSFFLVTIVRNMQFSPRIVIVVLLCGASALPLRCSAESPQTVMGPSIEQASYTQSASDGEELRSVRFGRQPAHVGDRTEQTVSLGMRLKLTMRRGSDLLGDNQTKVQTKQRRVIVATAVEDGIMMAARVQYPEATKQVVAAEAPTAGQAGDGARKKDEATAGYQPVAQVVQGKTYLVQREPGENGKLLVTDEAGNRPSAEEYEIVSAQMDMVGRPNPLAQYLAGREIKVGESFELPKDLASKVFNLGDKFGEVTHFRMTLRKVSVQGGATLAEFSANVEAAASGPSQMLLQVEGPLVVQADSCRAVSVAMDGPIGMSETRGSYSTAYQVIGTGHLQTSIAAVYREAKRE